jgi:hypothetical protein
MVDRDANVPVAATTAPRHDRVRGRLDRDVTQDDFQNLIDPLEERRNLEFKPGGDRNDPTLQAKVVRAILGMANLRDGGWVILGITDRPSPALPGIGPVELASWKLDDLLVTVNGFAEPNVQLDRFEVAHDGKTFLVIRVHGFDEIPVFCRKNSGSEAGKKGLILQEGFIYVRSTTKPETIPVRDPALMRELLELAIEKGIASFDRRARRLGYVRKPTDAERFEAQIEDLR